MEDRDVNADPERMASIAKAGSGIAMDGCYFDVVANHLPVVDHTETAGCASRVVQQSERSAYTDGALGVLCRFHDTDHRRMDSPQARRAWCE